MKAVLTDKMREVLSRRSRVRWKLNSCTLLKFLQSNKVDDEKVGICVNLNVGKLVEVVTGEVFPIRGEVWETNLDAYAGSVGKYRGSQLKQRRKLARKLLNIINQYLLESTT